ncbi:hypothetical protein SBA4_3950029 [Candidatus Sulfopaludibacter sp. SbA4]|nr:hypothetical protein SBA4_3950029 [Candidatus Sulfopaludibacter sp. SbA4]
MTDGGAAQRSTRPSELERQAVPPGRQELALTSRKKSGVAFSESRRKDIYFRPRFHSF